MTQVTFSGSSGTIPNLNANFSQLYDLREAITTSGYGAAFPVMRFTAAGLVAFGFPATTPTEALQLEKAAAIPRLAFLRSGIGTWYVGGPASGAGNSFEISFNAASPMLMSDGTNVRFGGSTAPTELVTLEKSGTVPRQAFLRTGVGTWYVGGPASGAGNSFEISFNAASPILSSDNAGVHIGNTSNPTTVALMSSAPALASNLDMGFQLVSNTSLKILVKGSDGTTRSVTLTLA